MELKTDIKNVTMKTCYECVKEEVEKERDKCMSFEVIDYSKLYVTSYDKDWVANVISLEYMQRVKNDTPMMIVSQTGSGKTTFIRQVLFQLALLENKKIAYFCSRKALKTQMKELVMNDAINKEQKGKEYKVTDYKEYYTDKKIEKEHDFGLIDIFSYQEFLNLYKMELNEYSAVVLDEAHFFLSDASFNRYTEEILDVIVKKFKNTRRIYLTATPEECLDSIYQKEMVHLKHSMRLQNIYELQTGMHLHLISENYSYLRPKFFESYEEIVKEILKDDTKKWMIFIRSKEMGEKIIKALSLPTSEITYFDADEISRKVTNGYKKLLSEEDLPSRILVCTKVLDVGINVKTPNLRLVFFEDNPVELKQMLGRKRVNKTETVIAYFSITTKGTINRSIGNLTKRIKEEREVIENLKEQNLEYPIDELEQPLFRKKEGEYERVCVNHFSEQKMIMDLLYYKKLQTLINDEDDSLATQIYIQHILRLFQIEAHEPEAYMLNYIPEGCKEEKLAMLLNSYLDTELPEDKEETLFREILEIVGDTRVDKRGDRKPGIKTVRAGLEAYGYDVESIGNPTRHRIVKKMAVAGVK